MRFSAVCERAAKSACIIFVCVHYHTFQVSACNVSLSILIDQWMDVVAKICTQWFSRLGTAHFISKWLCLLLGLGLSEQDQWMDDTAKICTQVVLKARLCPVLLSGSAFFAGIRFT